MAKETKNYYFIAKLSKTLKKCFKIGDDFSKKRCRWIMSESSKNVRRIRNYLLEPLLQVKLGLYTIGLTVIFSIIFAFGTSYLFGNLFELVLEVTELQDEVLAIFREHVANANKWLFIIVALYLLSVITVTVLYTHRLIGPTIAFKRHIRELASGNYSTRVNLRKRDAFEEVANELNNLAEELGKRET